MGMTGGAIASYFDRGLLGMEATVARPEVQSALDRIIGKFSDLAAGVADRKRHQAMPMVMRMRAGNEGVQAFQPMHHTQLLQFLQRAVDLQRRAKTILAQLVKQGIGAKRRLRLVQGVENQALVFGELSRVSHSFPQTAVEALDERNNIT